MILDYIFEGDYANYFINNPIEIISGIPYTRDTDFLKEKINKDLISISDEIPEYSAQLVFNGPILTNIEFKPKEINPEFDEKHISLLVMLCESICKRYSDRYSGLVSEK